MSAERERPFERVYTMTDYYDGPRGGIADLDGRPHLYSSPFEFWKDEYEDLYELRPVDGDTLALALEDWEIWLRWEEAFHAGRTAPDAHPALPADRARHDELAPLLAARLAALPRPSIRARGEFRPSGRGRWLEVRWSPARDA
jgi:hypothetical protein